LTDLEEFTANLGITNIYNRSKGLKRFKEVKLSKLKQLNS